MKEDNDDGVEDDNVISAGKERERVADRFWWLIDQFLSHPSAAL
jgi:hypothetical protein